MPCTSLYQFFEIPDADAGLVSEKYDKINLPSNLTTHIFASVL